MPGRLHSRVVDDHHRALKPCHTSGVPDLQGTPRQLPRLQLPSQQLPAGHMGSTMPMSWMVRRASSWSHPRATIRSVTSAMSLVTSWST